MNIGPRPTWVVLALAVLIVGGCDKLKVGAEEPIEPTPRVDLSAPAADITSPDASDMLGPEDAADTAASDVSDTVAAPDAPDAVADADGASDAVDGDEMDATEPPLRTLTTLPLPDDSPLDNRVVMPGLRGHINAVVVLEPPTLEAPVTLGRAHRHVRPEYPRAAASIEVMPGSAGSLLAIAAYFEEGESHEASLWVGREVGAADADLNALEVAVSGWNDTATGPFMVSAALIVDPTTEIVAGGVRWFQYRGSTSDFFGKAFLTVRTTAEEPYFAHAPVVQRSVPNPGALVRPAPPMSPAPADLELLAYFRGYSAILANQDRPAPGPVNRPQPGSIAAP